MLLSIYVSVVTTSEWCENKAFGFLCELKRNARWAEWGRGLQDGLGPQILRPLTFRPLLHSTPYLLGLTVRLMDATSWRILIPTKQCWQVFKKQPVSALSFYFIASWRGIGSAMVTLSASFQAGLGMLLQMNKDEGNWHKDPLTSFCSLS